MYSKNKEGDQLQRERQSLTRGGINEQHFTQIPDEFNGQQNGDLSHQNRGKNFFLRNAEVNFSQK